MPSVRDAISSSDGLNAILQFPDFKVKLTKDVLESKGQTIQS